jgi:cobalt-zinc-cadmium efflux system outer membrane protein
MKKFLFWGIGVITLIHPQISSGQELTLDEVLETAIQVNPALKSLENLVKARQGAARQADVPPNPSIGASAGNRVQLVKIGQEIEYPGKRAARTNAALEEVEAAKSEFDLAKLEIEQEATKLFYDVLWGRKNVELLQDNLRVTEKFSEAATFKFGRGFGSKLDVIKGQVEVVRARRLLKSAEQALVTGQSRLKILLKMPSTSSLLLKVDLSQTGFHFTGNLDSLLLVADQRHPALRAQKHRLKAVEHQIVLAQLSAKPNFDFELSGGMDDREPTIELSMILPLAVRDSKKGAKAEAQFQHKSLEYDFENARNSIAQRVTSAFLEYQAATETARLFEDTLLREAREAAETAQKTFEAGGFRFLDLIDAQRTYLEAGMEYYESLCALRHAEVDLQAAAGISTLQGEP